MPSKIGVSFVKVYFSCAADALSHFGRKGLNYFTANAVDPIDVLPLNKVWMLIRSGKEQNRYILFCLGYDFR